MNTAEQTLTREVPLGYDTSISQTPVKHNHDFQVPSLKFFFQDTVLYSGVKKTYRYLFQLHSLKIKYVVV